MFFTFFSLFLATALTLLVPLTDSNRQRCMIMYSFGDQQTMKIDMHFPMIPNKIPGEVYDFVIRNTETKEEKRQIVYQGNHKVQFHLQKSIIYDVCFSVRSNRRLEQELLIDYNADLQFIFKSEHIKIPQNLLKSKDLMRTYENAISISQINQKFVNLQKMREQKQTQTFEDNQQLTSKLLNYSRFQLFLIVGITIAQVFILRRFLAQGKYI